MQGSAKRGQAALGMPATVLRFRGRLLRYTFFREALLRPYIISRYSSYLFPKHALRLVQLPDSGNALYSVWPANAASG